MGRTPCCSKVGLLRGPWTPREDTLLISYIKEHGQGQWRSLPKKAGLSRCGKSCRLRWMNYLRPGIKRGSIGQDEEELILKLHALLGNRWSLIAGRLPGRTDNEIKNYWNSHLSKKLKRNGIDPINHKAILDSFSPRSDNGFYRSPNQQSMQTSAALNTGSSRGRKKAILDSFPQRSDNGFYRPPNQQSMQTSAALNTGSSRGRKKTIFDSFPQRSDNGFYRPPNQQSMQRSAALNSGSSGGLKNDGKEYHVTDVTESRLHMPKATRVIPKVPPPWVRRETKVLPVYAQRNDGNKNGSSDERCMSGYGVSLLDQNFGWSGHGELAGPAAHGPVHREEDSKSEIFQLWRDSSQNIVKDDHNVKMKIHERSLVCLEDEKMQLDSFIQSLLA